MSLAAGPVAAARRLRPTVRGTGLAVFASVTGVLSIATGSVLLTQAAVLGAGLLAATAAVTGWRVASCDLACDAPPDLVVVGGSWLRRFEVVRRGGDDGPLSIVGLCPPWCEGPDRLRTSAPGRAGFSLPLVVARRGVHQIPAVRVTLSDPMGLWRGTVTLAEARLVTAVPSPVDLPVISELHEPGSTGRAWLEDSQALSGDVLASSPPGPIPREYRPGDELRRIHWPATARSAQPLVRSEEPDGTRVCTVVLDRLASAYLDSEDFERAVVAAASVVTHFAELGWTAWVDTGGDPDRPRSALSGETASLLSRLRPLADVGVEPAGGGGFDGAIGGGLAVLVTGGRSVRRQKAAAPPTPGQEPIVLHWASGESLPQAWLECARPAATEAPRW